MNLFGSFEKTYNRIVFSHAVVGSNFLMTQSSKNKIRMFAVLLMLSLMAYVFLERPSSFYDKVITLFFLVLLGILNILQTVRNIIDFKIEEDILFIKKTFSKEQYPTKSIKGWSENEYHFFGIKTKSVIILKTESGKTIKIWKKGSKNYETLSDYLNDNSSKKYKNYH